MSALRRVVLAALAIGVSSLPGTVMAGDMPKGAHYNLNIIAVPKNNRPPDSNPSSNRHTIFVPRDTVKGNVDCRILLTNGGTTYDFQVVDGFCLDGNASFILPDPDPPVVAGVDVGDGVAEYQVWIALAGRPGGGANLTTCKVDRLTGEEVCSLENTITLTGNRVPGKPKWVNVTRELLTLCLNTDGLPGCDTRQFLFDDSAFDYLWQYDNWGNQIAKLRFYPVTQQIGFSPNP